MSRKAFLCTVVAALGLALACGKSTQTPTAPSGAAVPSDAGAAPDGSTLKVTAPTPVSPINGAQPDGVVVLIATKPSSKFAGFEISYQFQIRSGSTVTFDSGVTGGAGNGPDQVAYVPTVALTPDAAYTWRVRAAYQGAVGPWSTDASFKAPVGGYIRGNELFDPLTGGRTVGDLVGGATLTPDGVFLPLHESHVTYVLPQTLTQGEFSMMIKGLNTRTGGAKSKAFSMQEGLGDITTNDYRATIDFRGRNYPNPGAVTFRIITGAACCSIFDSPRQTPGGWDPNGWTFWRFTWRTGSASLEVRQDNETGPVKYFQSVSTGSHEYRPTPHVLHLGAPLGRGGADDATASQITIKNVWASPNPRPVFPN